MRDSEGNPDRFHPASASSTPARAQVHGHGDAISDRRDAIVGLAVRLATDHDLPAVFRRVWEAARSVLGADRCALFRCDGSRIVECLASSGLSNRYLAAVLDGDGHLPLSVDCGRRSPLVVPHIHAGPRAVPDRHPVLEEGFRAFVVAPMLVEGDLRGCLFLYFDAIRDLSDEEIDLADLLATLAAAAWENVRVHEENLRRAERLRVLNEIGLSVSRVLDLNDLYEVVYRQTCRVLNVDAFYIALVDEEHRLVCSPFFADGDIRVDLTKQVPLGNGPTSQVLRKRGPIRVCSSGDALHANSLVWGSERRSESAIYVPMWLGDRIIGVMSAQTYEPDVYTDDDIQMLETLASQTAVAVENTRLVQKLHDAALTDDLTGLPNRRAIVQRLHEESARVQRYGASSCLLLVDLDRFKQINDTMGHAAGDAVLRDLAGLLRRSLRSTDAVGRWGGEEFLVIVEHADAKGGVVAAEHLRHAVESHVFLDGSLAEPITVSIGGVAMVCGDAIGPDALLATADRRLYHAKATGRNQVVFTDDDDERHSARGAWTDHVGNT